MPFTKETADLIHYPETTKEDARRGYTVIPQPPLDNSNNMGQLKGRKIPIAGDYPELTD